MNKNLTFAGGLALAAALAVGVGVSLDDDSGGGRDPGGGSLYEGAASPSGDVTSSSAVDVDSIGRDTLRSEHPAEFGHLSDPLVDELFEITCTGLDDGLPVEAVVVAASRNFGDGPAGALVMAATMTACPEHRLLVDAWIEEWQ